MHHDHGERGSPLPLPMTMAEHADAGLDFNQPLFSLFQRKLPREKEASDGLDVSATQEASRPEVDLLHLDIGSGRCPHLSILNPEHHVQGYHHSGGSNPLSHLPI